MSSNNCENISTDHPSPDQSDVQPPEKRVCFICGSYTTLIINIHEPRCGPNMIDVISEKYKMRPLNDDKFVCYDCNNWLVNWYSMQKEKNNDDSNHESTSSTVSATIATNKTNGDGCIEGNENLIVISDDEENIENVDVNNIIRTLRDRLKKYLYYPNRRKDNNAGDTDFNYIQPQSTVIELDRPVSPDTTTIEACRRCGKSIIRNVNRQRICRKCMFSMQRCRKLTAYRLSRSRSKFKRNEPSKNRVNALSCRDIFEKLQQLGTSIYYESAHMDREKEIQRQQKHHHHHYHHQQQQQQHRNHERVTSIPHESDTIHDENDINGSQKRTNESNEILMTFNTVVTEVFPMELLYSYESDRDRPDDQTNNKHEFNPNINDILKNVPKSLTITVI